MKASSFFKFFVRSLMIVFIIAFTMNISHSNKKAPEDFKEKLEKLQIENNDLALSSWISLDQTLAKAHLKASMVSLNESDSTKFKNELKIAKLLMAGENQSPVYLEILKIEKAFENVVQLKKTFEGIPVLTQKFVRVISNNPMIVGHVIEEKNNTVSIRDQDGFIIPIHRKNIVSMNEIDGKEKEKIFKDLLTKIMEDNGKTSSYGLYLSAKWAHENNLQDKVNSILIEAAMNDSQILMTIPDNEARKLLSMAKWSNLLGDYEIAKNKAQEVINSYGNTSQLKDAQETLADILANIEKSKEIRSSLVEKKPVVDNAIADSDKPEEFVKPPVITKVEPEPEPAPVVGPINTLKIKSKISEEINKDAITPTKPEITDNEIDEKTADNNDIKNPPIKNALYQNKTYQEALELVNEGKKFMKVANSFDNPGNKNAQSNYRLALAKFEQAVSKINSISKKFSGNEEFEELANQASGMHFFITKTCIRIKY